MNDDVRIEIVAQSLWLKMFGVTSITAAWQDWSIAHSGEANLLRDKAKAMLDVHRGHTQANITNHSSLGWLP